ncbi:hypothetical protein VOLCADRAFT_117258 [Volvox carteri f. nagariensis]|uniref:Galactose oxidase n=1 Tax=Volvox carteri f. nagariensis TaxID=3068 RepID=D8TSY3_VOLCA|nr:uncharacterized protein VOLCADRAFT_117258 [Volvox carteri f. nagariensis]EFJ49559.1 hypothetical protein VOLCADRAFT_117258 [Volvox carteri f. nagariensis]|eukprot:XP_002949540.1 hypothetical protein VOLCADRAFT_117258 [Volvox carteri f. nagariensis]
MGGQWRLVKPAGLAPAPRGAHASVALGTKVLVFGGADRAPVPFNDLWVLETAGGKYEWTRISPLMAPGCKLLPRSGATLTALGDRVFLFGGTEPVSGVCFNELKVLDAATWTWSDVQAQGTLPPARHSHCSGCLADTCLIVYGGAGYQGPMQDLWIYNTLQNSWSRPTVAGAQPQSREMHTGCMVDDTTMLVYGGRGPNFKVCCDAALFDARQMKWTVIEPTPFSRCAHSCVVLPGASAGAATGSTTAATASQKASATATEGKAGGSEDGADVEAGEVSEPGTSGGGGDGGQAQHQQQQQDGHGASTALTEEGLAGSAAAAAAAALTTAAAASSGGGGGGDGASCMNHNSNGSSSGSRVLIYGGYSGEAVEGDLLQIDSRTLEIELVRRGPRESDKGGTVPSVRFAHSAVVVPTAPSSDGGVSVSGVSYTMVVFGGVNPKEDLNDVAVWVFG